MNNHNNFKFIVFLVVLLGLAGCSTPETSEPIPLATNTSSLVPSPEEEVIPSLESPTATAVIVDNEMPSSPTPIPPPATATMIPTLAPTATNSPEPTATAVPLPAGWLGPGNFPPDVNPLTGQEVEDPQALERRPVAIKVSNYPALVRPQAGLNNADLVFEHYAEGGATRFTAVFYGQDAHTVGSVRSARIIDFEIPVMYDAAFGYSGAAGPNKERFSEAEWYDRIISPDFGHKGFYRNVPDDSDVDFWHTMFTDTYRLREILQDRGLDVAPQFQNGMVFSPEPPEGGSNAKQVEIGYRGSYVTWWYDSGTGRYYRWNDGNKHDDANTDKQINSKNVIVISARHVDTWIPETEVGQGAKSVEIQIWGEGSATIFRDGQRYDGRWVRNDPQDMLTFFDMDGNPLPLGPGNSWIELVPLGFDKLYVTS